MFVRRSSTKNSPRQSIRVCKSIRENGKVKQITVLYLGVAADEKEAEELIRQAKEFIIQEQHTHYQAELQHAQSPTTAINRRSNITLQNVTVEDKVLIMDLKEEQRIVEGIHEVAGHVYDSLGYSDLVINNKDKERLRDFVLMRIAEPSSKYKTQNLLNNKYAKAHDMSAIYRLMDKLYPQIDALKMLTFNKTKEVNPGTIDLLLFDCTTLYFESVETDELRAFGYSKDCRFNTTQVVLALATNSNGLPIGYELFEGNKAEVSTLVACIKSWEKSFKIGQVCFVADRAMMSDENLTLLENLNYTYVIAAKLRGLPSVLKNQILDEKNYKAQAIGDNFGWIGEFEYKKRRLVVSYKTARAERDCHQRSKIVKKIKQRLGNEGDTQKLITNQGVKKFTKSDKSKTVLAQEKIDNDSMWDGLHGIITNIKPKKTLAERELPDYNSAKDKGEDAVTLLCRYGRLWKIEECFRLNKHTLSMRPIYHFKVERVKTHIAICYMAFSVFRYMEYQVKLFQKISPETIIEELVNVQASIYRHELTDKRYRIPGKFSKTAEKIYKAFQLKRGMVAQLIIRNSAECSA